MPTVTLKISDKLAHCPRAAKKLVVVTVIVHKKLCCCHGKIFFAQLLCKIRAFC